MSSGSPILLKIVSEKQFSGKTHFYTIASRARLASTLFTFILLVSGSICMSLLMFYWYEDRFVQGGQLTCISK